MYIIMHLKCLRPHSVGNASDVEYHEKSVMTANLISNRCVFAPYNTTAVQYVLLEVGR